MRYGFGIAFVYFSPVCTLEAQIFLDSDLLKLWGTVAPEGGQLPDLRFTSGSKDETRSQCLGDNEVFDEQAGAAAGECEEACGPGGEPLNLLHAGVGLPGRGRAIPQAISMQEPRAPSLKGYPADLAPLSPEKSPREREDSAAAVTRCLARRMQTLPSSQPSSAAAVSLPASFLNSTIQTRHFPLHPFPFPSPACLHPDCPGVLSRTSHLQN